MELRNEDIIHISNLARLDITEEEAALFHKQLSSILGYIEAIADAPTDGVEPMAQSVAMHAAMRPDVAAPATDAVREALLKSFPDAAADGSLRVKAVFS